MWLCNKSIDKSIIHLQNRIDRLVEERDELQERINKIYEKRQIYNSKLNQRLDNALEEILYYTKNINYITINQFFEELYNIISKEKCMSSYADFNYRILLPTNELYVGLSDSDKIISLFSSKYNMYNITKITDIKRGEISVNTYERGSSRTGFYYAIFTVYYKKLEDNK